MQIQEISHVDKREIRYRKRPPMVRNMRAVQKPGFWCTRRVFGRALHRKGPLPFWRLLYSARAMLSFFWQFEKFGTGDGLLWYGKFTRCTKRLPGVRDAFSEAFGVKNRLLRYGRDIRYRKRPPLVRGASSERRLFDIAACGTIKRGISLWIVSQADFMHNISLSPQMA